MATKLLNEAKKLSPTARIKLVGEIWDSLSQTDVHPTLSTSQQRELDRRLKRVAKTGSVGSEWSIVKRRLLKASKG